MKEKFFNIIFFIAILLLIQSVSNNYSFQKRITNLELKIQKLEYKNIELKREIEYLRNPYLSY